MALGLHLKTAQRFFSVSRKHAKIGSRVYQNRRWEMTLVQSAASRYLQHCMQLVLLGTAAGNQCNYLKIVL